MRACASRYNNTIIPRNSEKTPCRTSALHITISFWGRNLLFAIFRSSRIETVKRSSR